MDTTFTAAPLPSLSPLSEGSLRPASTAMPLYETAFREQHRRWLETAGGTRYPVHTGRAWSTKPASAGDAGQQLLYPRERTAPRTPSQRLPSSSRLLRSSHSEAHAAGGVPSSSAAGQAPWAGAGVPPPPQRLATPLPSSRALRTPGRPTSSSWNRPLSTLATMQQQPPPSRMGTPSLTADQLLRQCTPGMPPMTAGGGRPATSGSWARPGTSASHGGGRPGTSASRCSGADVWSRDGPLPPPAPATPPPMPSHLVAGMSPRMAALAADPRALARANAAPPASPSHPVPQPVASPPFLQRPATTSTRLQSPGCNEQLQPSRGLVYSVFQDLDRYGEGRITSSNFEAAALMVGMTPDQATSFFSRLDSKGRGYFTIADWGQEELEAPLAEFSRLYAQKTRRPDGRYRGVNEIDNLCSALELGVLKLTNKNNGYGVGSERLLEAFRFVDRGMTGSLKASEMHDAFDGLGIYVSKQVLDDAVKTFADHSGGVGYSQFISTLFDKTMSRGVNLRTCLA